MSKNDKHQDQGKNTKKVDKVNKNNANVDKLDMDEQNTKGDDRMENTIERERYKTNDVNEVTEDKFSDIYAIGEEFAKLLGVKNSKDVYKILKKK